MPELHPGDTVNHQVFGRGIVVDLDGEVAAVQFGGKGIKRLNISFAPLEKVS